MTDLENKQKKMLDQAAQMRLESAKGNKSVESRKGGTTDVEPMKSPNEPNISADLSVAPIKSNAEIAAERERAKVAPAREAIHNEVKQSIDENFKKSQPTMKDLPAQPNLKPQTLKTKASVDHAREINKEIEKNKPFEGEKYVREEFDRAKHEKEFDNNQTFQDIIARANKQDDEYKAKAEKASKYAKATAWGNMFNALGQIAGLGKNTYVKPDSKYLDRALSKADEARAMYDKIKAANDAKRSSLKADYLTKAEAQHWANEKLKADSIKELNKVMQSANKADKELAIKMYTANIDKMYKDGLLSKKDYENETKRITALAAQTRANASAKNAELKETEANRKTENNRKKAESSAFINYKDNDIKQNYNLNESEARRIANYMIKNKNYTADRLGLIGDAITGTISASNYGIFKSQVLDFIEHGGGKDIPEVKAILDNSDNYSFDTLGEESDL